MKTYIIGNLRFLLQRTLIVLSFIIVIALTYFFYVPSVEVFGHSFNNPIYPYFEYLVWWKHLIVYFTIICFTNAFIFLLASFYYIIKKDRALKKEKDYSFSFTQKMIGYLYSDHFKNQSDVDDYFKYFRKNVKGKLALSIFFDVIVKIQNLISEDFRMKFNELIDHIKVRKDIEYFLFSKNLSEKIIALKIISFLGLHKYDDTISKYIKSKNYALRNEAVMAYMRLSESNNLDFLMSHKYHLSTLQINSIINAVNRSLKDDETDYGKMMESGSARINVAGAMLIGDKTKPEYRELIKSALTDKDSMLREVAWEAYANIGKSENDIDYMLSSFENETQENKQTILKGLKGVELNEALMNFLDKIVKTESILIKIFALRLIFEDDMNNFLAYQKIEDAKIAIACREVADFNIN